MFHKVYSSIKMLSIVCALILFTCACSATGGEIESKAELKEKKTVVFEDGIERLLCCDEKNSFDFEVAFAYINDVPTPCQIAFPEETISYEYANGLRTAKNSKAGITEFQYVETSDDGSFVLSLEKTPEYQIDYLYSPIKDVFLTETSEEPFYSKHTLCGFVLDGEEYRYTINPDNSFVMGIVDSNGNTVIKYEYKDWKAVRILELKGETWVDATYDETSVGYRNKIRAWMYYFDDETEWYYSGEKFYFDSEGNAIEMVKPVVVKE